MKKIFIAMLTLLLMLPAGAAFAQTQENELLVVLGSDPEELINEAGDSYLDVAVGDEITFTRKVVSIGMDSFTFVWNFDPLHLLCNPEPDFDSPDLVCNVVAEGESTVSITIYGDMNDDSLKTAESKEILVRAQGGTLNLPDYYGHQNETAIEFLYDEGIVEGYPDGTFKPDNYLTRAELMKILVLGAGYDPDENEYNNCFPDVGDDWFARYVCFAYENGWVQGYPDGTFKPGNDVLRPEAIKMLLEIFGVDINESLPAYYNDVPENAWYYHYIMTAFDMALLEEEQQLYKPDNPIMRGQVSENIYRLLMDEQERFDIAAKTTLCETFYFGDADISTTPLEELEPLMTEKLQQTGFNVPDSETYNAITSRHSFTGNEFLTDPAAVCEG